jgi:predicted RNA binding protein YcfA (HicA-like mRNA interferase family)
MKTVSGKKLCGILQAKGWRSIRVHGSHHIFTKEDRDERICVPVHGNSDLKIGLQKAIMKIADIKDDDIY